MLSAFVILLGILVSGLVSMSFSGEIPNILTTLIIGVFLFALCYDLNHSKQFHYVSVPIVLGYIWRISLVYLDIYGTEIFQLPNSGADSLMYYREAVSYAQTWSVIRGGVFSRMMGVLFSIAGHSRLFGQLIVVLFSMVAILSFVLIMRSLGVSQYIQYKLTLLVALLPNFAILSSIFLRESIVTMLLSLSLVLFVRWLSGKSEKWFIGSIVFAVLASSFHSGSIGVALGYVLVRLLYNRTTNTFQIKVSNILITLLLAFAFSYLFINYGDTFFGKMTGITSITSVANTSTEGGSSYARYVGNSNSPISMIIFTIPRIIYFLFSPFPWQWRGLSDIIAFMFSSLFYMYAVWNAYKTLRRSTGDTAYLKCFLIVAACITFIFAWGVSNTGTAARHREKMVILYGAIYALSIHCNRS